MTLRYNAIPLPERESMSPSRRTFLTSVVALACSAVPIRQVRAADGKTGISPGARQGHAVLLGDSIFDNGSYTGGKPDVIAQLRERLPRAWKATLLAVDGATTGGIPAQLARLPADATHLVMSIGGNDALGRQALLDTPVRSTAQALTLLAQAAQEFETSYRKAVDACMKQGLPLTICTIYNGNFADADYQRRASTGLTIFNDVIVRAGIERRLNVIDLRQICRRAEDFANSIEPSSIGGAKIAQVIARMLTEPASVGAARIIVD